MSEKNEVLTYKGHPLMRKDNLVYYGSMADEFIVMLQILETKARRSRACNKGLRPAPAHGSRRQGARPRGEEDGKDGFYTALDVGCVWLERALNAK